MDDIIKTCPQCGHEHEVHPYRDKITCPECGHITREGDSSAPTIRVEDDCVIITHSGGHEYDIELDRIPDWQALVRWIHQLSEKAWMHVSTVELFIDVVTSRKGWNLHQ